MSSLSLLSSLFITITIALSIEAASIGREKRQSEPQVYKIPLLHERSSRNTWSKMKRAKRDTTLMANSGAPSAPKQHHGLSSDNDFYYYGLATIGTPPQEFRMYLDTGSADIWVPGSKCNTVFCNSSARRRFDESASRTLHPTSYEFNITYCDNTTASGVTAYDAVSMAGLTAFPQAFGIMTDVHDPGSNRLEQYDGIFGLSYPQTANPGTIPFFLNLVLQNAIPAPIFSFWLNRDPKTSQQKGGELTFGGMNPDHYEGPIHYFPLSHVGEWGVDMHTVAAKLPNGKVVELVGECEGSCGAIIDTGTAYIVGPGIAELLEALEEEKIIQANEDYTNIIECSRVNELPTLMFQFKHEKKVLTLEPIHYTFPIDAINGSCYRAVALDNASCSGDKYILGDSFLGKYYSIYDMGQNRVGLALAKKGEDKVHVKETKEERKPAIHLDAFATGSSQTVQSHSFIAGLLMALLTVLLNVH